MRMRFEIILGIAALVTALPGRAATLPVKDAKTAISIAKEVCRNKVLFNMPSAKWRAYVAAAKWRAEIYRTNDTWIVSTDHINPGSGTWMVMVPVNGERPNGCSAVGMLPPNIAVTQPAQP
jgi:hypothetical protein